MNEIFYIGGKGTKSSHSHVYFTLAAYLRLDPPHSGTHNPLWPVATYWVVLSALENYGEEPGEPPRVSPGTSLQQGPIFIR